MTDACEAIENKIKECGGLFNIKMAPKVVTATDEADLAKQMERAEMENAEVNIYFEFLYTCNFAYLDLSVFVYKSKSFSVIK